LSRIKIIGRGGVGMDNIDVDYAKSKGITVINTLHHQNQ
jgi:D-3-phosphoglycerate dehydrogenase